jgi:hypothetical protein
VDASGGWTNWNGPWNSALKMHAAGYLDYSDGELFLRGSAGEYWSSTPYNATFVKYMDFSSGGSGIGDTSKASGLSVRCIK